MAEASWVLQAAGFAASLGLILTASFTSGPYSPPKLKSRELPPIRDVSMDPPALWTWDEDAFMDPPRPYDPDWVRVGSARNRIAIS